MDHLAIGETEVTFPWTGWVLKQLLPLRAPPPDQPGVVFA